MELAIISVSTMSVQVGLCVFCYLKKTSAIIDTAPAYVKLRRASPLTLKRQADRHSKY